MGNPSFKIVMYTLGLPFTGNSLEKTALGGSETAFIYVARSLCASGHQVIGFCNCSEEGFFDGVEYRSINRFDEFRNSQSCDLFICSRYFDVFKLPINARVKILWNHDNLVPETIHSIKLIIKSIDYMYCLSDFHVQQYHDQLAYLYPIIKKNSNGVDLGMINSIVEKTVQKRHKVMYISRPERGLLQALDIYASLGDKTLEFLACSYNYPGEDISSADSDFVERIKSLQNEGYPVKLNTFSKPELYKEIAESKVVLFPNLYAETFCIGAIETQACKTVFLTSQNSALAETVAYPNLPFGDKESFISALKSLLSNEFQRKRLEESGYRHVQKYSWSNVAKVFETDAVEFLMNSASAKFTKDISLQISDIEAYTKLVRAPLPKISCLTVTQGRVKLLKDAILCYCKQDYPNKELIIVTNNADHVNNAIKRFIDSLDRKDIFLITFKREGYNLGKARNLSIDVATGDHLCIWDDDDLYHPKRLSYQYQVIKSANAQAAFLTEHLHFFQEEQELYWVDWRYGNHLSFFERLIPGSMLINRSLQIRYPESGQSAFAGEDNVFINALKNNHIRVAAATEGHGFLYLYRCHGNNTHAIAHHRRLQAFGSQDTEFIQQRMPALLDSLKQFSLPTPLIVKNRKAETIFIYK